MAENDKKKAVKVEIEDGAEEAPSPQTPEQAEPVEMTEEEMVEAAKRRGAEQAEAEIAEKQQQDMIDLEARAVEAETRLEDAAKAAEEANDKLLRLQADWENFRRRTAAERLAERERATEGLVEKLLPVIDDLERAIDHAASSENAELTQFVEGVAAVHAKIVSVLEKEGVEVIDPAGEPFDPLAHQAVGREENAEVFDETVAQVYQKGYRMGGKVIRSAMVTVTYGGPKRPAEEAEAQDEKQDGAAE